MRKEEVHHVLKKLRTTLIGSIYAILILLMIIVYMIFPLNRSEQTSATIKVKPNKEIQSELAEGEGLALVIQNCTSCHSEKLIIQNRGDEQYWKSLILWMQQTQNLWDLGENQQAIVTYLSKYYGPIEKSRRVRLTQIEWHPIKKEYN